MSEQNELLKEASEVISELLAHWGWKPSTIPAVMQRMDAWKARYWRLLAEEEEKRQEQTDQRGDTHDRT